MGSTVASMAALALTMRALGSLWGPAGEGMARDRVAKAMREKRANLTKENMTSRKAKRKEWGRL